MAGIDWDSGNDDLAELAAQVSELASRVERIWSALAGRGLGEVSLPDAARQGGLEKLLGMNLTSWARRAGFYFARGSGWSPLEHALRGTLERELGKRWEKLLVRSMGTSVLTSFVGGAGVALVDSLFSAVSRAIKPRRLNLPELMPLPHGSFPAAASYRQVLPPGSERTSAREVVSKRTSSVELTPAAQAIESALAERLKRELP